MGKREAARQSLSFDSRQHASRDASPRGLQPLDADRESSMGSAPLGIHRDHDPEEGRGGCGKRVSGVPRNRTDGAHHPSCAIVPRGVAVPPVAALFPALPSHSDGVGAARAGLSHLLRTQQHGHLPRAVPPCPAPRQIQVLRCGWERGTPATLWPREGGGPARDDRADQRRSDAGVRRRRRVENNAQVCAQIAARQHLPQSAFGGGGRMGRMGEVLCGKRDPLLVPLRSKRVRHAPRLPGERPRLRGFKRLGPFGVAIRGLLRLPQNPDFRVHGHPVGAGKLRRGAHLRVRAPPAIAAR
mmetsp:Transcript_34477/g.81679  ORF Transcript_34477/g.81679 Transcript_34477/m.81679 type:complete len:299 (+) Transcript_34477:142-1038(+)